MELLGGEPIYIAGIAKKVAEGDLSMNLQSSGVDRGIFAGNEEHDGISQ